MSNFLAIATATATLQQLLLTSLSADVAGADATTLRPDNASLSTPGNFGVNIYLYQANPSVAWRNHDLPTRRSTGQTIQRPRLALDLYYLLTFYGEEETLQPQRILGSVARTLNGQPILTRDLIQATIDAAVAGDENHFLGGSDLANEIERVKFTPVPLSLEELSKLWSVFFQTPYTLSMAFIGSVVFVESAETPLQTLPVQTRDISVTPSLLPPSISPDALANLVLWLRSDRGVTYDIDGVSAWADQSEIGNNALQADATRRPAFVAHGLGQYPILRFDGDNDYLAIENLSYATNGALEGITVYALVRSVSPDRQIILSFDRDEYWRLSLKDGVNVNVGFDTTDETGSTSDLRSPEAYSDDRWHVIAGRFDAIGSPNRQLIIDGVEVAADDAQAGNNLGSGDVTRFGFVGVGSEAPVFDGTRNPSFYLDADVAELVIYHRALDDSERTQLEQYFQQRYNP